MIDLKPVQDANRDTAIDLLAQIPDHIEGSNQWTSPENLRWLLERVIAQSDSLPVDKTGRWIGFVQGVLAMSNNMDVMGERDATRARYHAAYAATGQIIPPTMQMDEPRQ